MQKLKRAKDLQGLGRLSVDAITQVSDIVEDLHQSIASLGGLLGSADAQRTRGLTGFVYWNIRSIAGLLGGGIDLALQQFSSLLGDKTSDPAREAVLAALNGVLGDHLKASSNPLAIDMQIRIQGEAIQTEDATWRESISQAQGKILVLLHGSCMNDLQWNHQGQDFGARLALELGYYPLYLNYNTGLHISENGQLFSDIMHDLTHHNTDIKEVTILAHSMGGLVARSACRFAEQQGQNWPDKLRKMIFLGSPHHGAPLERGGPWLEMLLKISPYSAPFARLGQIRSAGITDLRYGSLCAKDWQNQDRFALVDDVRELVPLPKNTQCYAIAASLAKTTTPVGNIVLGDGLVPVNSALGLHKDKKRDLKIPESRQWLAQGMNHLDLLSSKQVYEKIKAWMQDPDKTKAER